LGQRSFYLKVIVWTHTHLYNPPPFYESTHTHNIPIALRVPLKWSLVIVTMFVCSKTEILDVPMWLSGQSTEEVPVWELE